MTDQPITPSLTPVDDDQNFLTWEELTIPQIKTRFVPELGKSVKYLSFVPLDKLLEFQARARLTTQNKDLIGFYAMILQYVMVLPACRTPEAARAAMKGNAPLLLSIAEEVAGKKEADEMRVELAKN